MEMKIKKENLINASVPVRWNMKNIYNKNELYRS
jgi:hypothetical protein